MVEHLKLDRGELAEGALAATAVVGPFDPGDDREASSSRVAQSLPVQDVLLQQGEEGLHRGVVAARTDPAHRPDEPVVAEVRTKAWDRNWLPRSEWTIVSRPGRGARSRCAARRTARARLHPRVDGVADDPVGVARP